MYENKSVSCYIIDRKPRHTLEDCGAVDMRANTSWTVRRRTGEEEEPPVFLSTSLCQLLEIQHLTQRHAPQG